MWRYTFDLVFVMATIAGGGLLFAGLFFAYKFFINKRLKGKFVRLYLPRISSLIIAVAILTSGVIGGYFINSGVKNRLHSLYAKIGMNRAEDAQYLPDIKKLSKTAVLSFSAFDFRQDSGDLGNYSKLNDMNTDITLENYNGLIENLGAIYSPFDAEFSIMDVKELALSLFDEITIFDKWLSFPGGKLSGQGEFYLSYDDESEHLTLYNKRGSQPYVWDKSKGAAVWNGSFPEYYLLPGQKGYKPNFSPIIEYTVIKIDYYYENGVEVVECQTINVLSYFGKSYVVKMQYIKNVKDTSFTKYIITPVPSLYSAPGGEGYGVLDIESANPYGTECSFTQMDYLDADNIKLLFVNQVFRSAYGDMPDITDISLYAKSGDELTLYNTVFSPELSFYNSNVNNDRSQFNVFLETWYDDLFKMYIAQSGGKKSSRGSPQYYDANYKTKPSAITGQSREIIYKKGKDITVYEGDYAQSFAKGLIGVQANADKLPQASTLLNASLELLAKGASGKSGGALTVLTDITTSDSAYENSVQAFLKIVAKNAVNASYLYNEHSEVIKAAEKYILV